MKKVIKKMLAVTTAVMMMLASVISVSAAGTQGTISFHTGSHNVNGVGFKVYRMMDATVSGSNVAYTINADFDKFFTDNLLSGVAGESKNEKAYNYIKQNVASAEFQNSVKAYVTTNSVVAKDTLTGVTGTKVYTTKTLEFGYYVIIPSGDVFTPSFTTLSKDTQNVYLKGKEPGVDKKTDGQDWSSAQIGDTVNFTVTSMVPNMTGFDSYTFKLTDTMSNGLTVTRDTLNLAVKIGNQTLTSDKYTVSVEGQKITVDITNFIQYKDKANEEIVFTYSAVLNEKAVSTNPENNTANVHWGNNPGQLNDGTPDTVYVHTHKLTINKVDESKQGLAGAEFELYRGTDVNGATMKFVDLTNGNYRVAKEGEGNTTTKLVSPAGGTITVEGLDAGEYRLVETKAPDGYNKLSAPVAIKIGATTENAGQNITVTGNTQEVINKAGSLLPETGGIGTVMFTIIGGVGILVIAASFLLGNKKKKIDNE